MKNSYLTVTDQFCGAGGSSQGVRNLSRKLGGVEVKLAMNHWKLAIETHNTNFPEVDHDCTDISASDPRRYPSTDILITSPECTTHSPSGGNTHKRLKSQMDMFDSMKVDPATERSRATMWDVCRFAEYHLYNIIIVENVVEAKTRWPLFDTWLRAMHVLGYEHKCCYLNSQHFHPTPQSRDRMYVVFWKKGNKAPNLDYTPTAYCAGCSKDVNSFQWWKNPERKYGKYKQQYLYRCPTCLTVVEPYYYAAFNIIDWSIPGKPVLGRKKPLSENTIRRIEYGLKKYGHDPMIVTTRYSSGVACRVRNTTSEVLPTQPGDSCHSIVAPMIIKSGFGRDVKKANEPLPTQTCQDSTGIFWPYIINNGGTGGRDDIAMRNTKEPLRTIRTSHDSGIVIPFMVELNRTGKARSTKDPLSTVLAGANHHAVVIENNGLSKARSVSKPLSTVTTKETHGILNPESIKSFFSYYYNGGDQASGLHESIRTVTGKDRAALVSHSIPKIEDCTYRTIRPHEVQSAMAFESDYIVLGTAKDKVKQCGNAVTPPVMEWLTQQCVESLNNL